MTGATGRGGLSDSPARREDVRHDPGASPPAPHGRCEMQPTGQSDCGDHTPVRKGGREGGREEGEKGDTCTCTCRRGGNIRKSGLYSSICTHAQFTALKSAPYCTTHMLKSQHTSIHVVYMYMYVGSCSE